MNATIVPINQIYHDLKRITEKVLSGESFLVVKNSKPIFKITPYKRAKMKKYNLSDFKKIRFSGDKNLSKNIDKVLYG